MAGENGNPNGGQPGAGGATPAFDPDKMRSMIREELQQAMNTDGKGDDPVRYDQAAPADTAPTNPLEAVINPLIAPHIRSVAIAAEGAKDAATFYVSHPEAVKHQADIENAFNQLVAQGTPFTREAVWDWYRGRNFDKFLQEARTADQKKIDDAHANSDAGGGMRPDGRPVKNAHDATDEELKSALSGISF